MEYLKAARADQLPADIAQLLSQARANKKKTTLVTGVFDLLHDEHKAFLEKAKQLADMLIVGLESDARVRAMKGQGRPKQSEAVRWQQIVAVPGVDAAFVLPDDFSKPAHHKAVIAAVLPTYLAVSSHSPHLDKKQAIMQQYGGEVVVVHEHNPAISTSVLLAKEQR